jgi:DNA topoisomerase-2
MAMKSSNAGEWLNWVQHVLKRPDVYIGSIKTYKSSVWVATTDEAQKITIQKINKFEYNEGLERVHMELISNAVDNKWRSDETSTPQTKITINMDAEEGSFSIQNDGCFIPVEQKEYSFTDPSTKKVIKRKMYPQQLFFGEMLTGTNYNDDEVRKTSGRNGMGAKATNIFSNKFVVECVDSENGLKYSCTYSNNRGEETPPKIRKSVLKKGYTKITFYPDFSKFGFKSYTEQWVNLLRKHACDCAMVTKNPTFFNGQKIVMPTLVAYSKLFLPQGTKTINIKTDDCEIVLAEQVGKEEFSHMSFVNGINTFDGGVHVEKWKKALLEPIREAFSKKTNTKKDEGQNIRIMLKDIEEYFFLFIRCEIDKPKFNSQSKTSLKSPTPKVIPLTATQLRNVMGWSFTVELNEKIAQKQALKIKKTDGSKRKNLDTTGIKVNHANWAGTAKSNQCVLFVTEGDSAKTIAIKGITSIAGGRNTMGAFALKGKPMNAMNNTAGKVNANKEIQNLKQVLGLRHGIDYGNNKEFSTLNYGKVILLCDQDVDGFHISGLSLLIFRQEFPTLYKRNYISIMNTPIIRVKIPRSITPVEFYTVSHYKKWEIGHKKILGNRNTEVRYYKGLGTNSDADAAIMFEQPKIVQILTENEREETINLGFNEKPCWTNMRKDWINDFEDSLVEENEYIEGDMEVVKFVENRLRSFHVENVRGKIPSIYDGLKESQRKILYGCFKRNLTKCIKVAQLGGYVSENSAYHHGEASLYDAIVKMAQRFVGSNNNIPLLYNEGQFGSRLEGGSDSASPRYIFTRLEEITRYIFRVEDDCLLERVIDDNDVVEPRFYLPIIPMILINGARGIASGFSTNIPCYDPETIVNWIKIWLLDEGEDYPELIPWWNGFRGDIVANSEQVVTYGKLETTSVRGTKKWKITELPIGLWTNTFEDWLNGELKNSKIVTKWTNDVVDRRGKGANKINFTLSPSSPDFVPNINGKGKKIGEGNEINFGILKSTFSLRNMVALDKNRKGVRFETPEEILEVFCKERYDLYGTRKAHLLKELRRLLTQDENKTRFINEVIVAKKIVLFDREKEDIVAELEEKNYGKVDDGYGYLLSMPFSTITKGKLGKLKKSIEGLKTKIKDLEAASIEELWNKDLDEFLVAYKKFLKTM